MAETTTIQINDSGICDTDTFTKSHIYIILCQSIKEDNGTEVYT